MNHFKICDHVYRDCKRKFITRGGNDYPKGTFGASTLGTNVTRGYGQNNTLIISSGSGARLTSLL